MVDGNALPTLFLFLCIGNAHPGCFSFPPSNLNGVIDDDRLGSSDNRNRFIRYIF